MNRRHSGPLTWGLVLVTLTAVGDGTPGQDGSPRIPLKKGLTIVTALNDPDKGDYESIKVIAQADSETVRLNYSADVQASGDEDNPLAALFGGAGADAAEKEGGSDVRQVRATRTVFRRDLESAIEYRWLYGEQLPETYPGSTALGVSKRVLDELRTKGETELRVPVGGVAGALGSLIEGLLGGSSPEFDAVSMASGTLERVSPRPVPFKVIVNDDPVELPAVHARGRLGDEDAEFWILDDVDNPLALKWEVGGTRLQVIKLAFPAEMEPETGGPMPGGGAGQAALGAGTGAASGTDGAGGAERGAGASASGAAGAGGETANAAAGTAKRIEADLMKEGCAVVYGIYFDFASDRIKEESEPVLSEIAQVLRQNPTWNLNVEGHTDSIGGDVYNLGLSQRRSASVRQALVTRYAIDANRLQTSGFGASRPKDRNDTMEGRARNRRVELCLL